MPTEYHESHQIAPRATGIVSADRTLGRRLKDKPSRPQPTGRECHCGKKISKWNPNDTCWEHTAATKPRIRGG